jgi:hypothetical protein
VIDAQDLSKVLDRLCLHQLLVCVLRSKRRLGERSGPDRSHPFPVNTSCQVRSGNRDECHGEFVQIFALMPRAAHRTKKMHQCPSGADICEAVPDIKGGGPRQSYRERQLPA